MGTPDRTKGNMPGIDVDTHRESVGTHYLHHVSHNPAASKDVSIAVEVPGARQMHSSELGSELFKNT